MTTEDSLTNSPIHIGLAIPENAPDSFIEKIVEGVKIPNLTIEVHKQENVGIYASFEWVVPSAIAAYIFKPYFEGFLSEAGKDHYVVLKEWLKKLTSNARAIKVHTIYSSYATKKRNGSNTQSKSISLLIQTKNNIVIKLLFDETLTQADWDNAIEQFLDLATDQYKNFPNDKLSAALSSLEIKRNHYVYATIDQNSKELTFFDNNKLAQLHKGQIDNKATETKVNEAQI